MEGCCAGYLRGFLLKKDARARPPSLFFFFFLCVCVCVCLCVCLCLDHIGSGGHWSLLLCHILKRIRDKIWRASSFVGITRLDLTGTSTLKHAGSTPDKARFSSRFARRDGRVGGGGATCKAQQLAYIGFNLERAGARFIAHVGNSLAVAEEFCEIPLDEAAKAALDVGFKVAPNRVGTTAVDLTLFKGLPLNTLAIGKGLDGLVPTRLLQSKLVARKGQNLQPLITVTLVENLEFSIVLGRQASVGRHIDHKTDLFL